MTNTSNLVFVTFIVYTLLKIRSGTKTKQQKNNNKTTEFKFKELKFKVCRHYILWEPITPFRKWENDFNLNVKPLEMKA